MSQTVLPPLVLVFLGIFLKHLPHHSKVPVSSNATRKKISAATPHAIAEDNVLIWSPEKLFHRLAEAATENSRPRNTGLFSAAAKGGHPIRHVRANGARHGRAVRVQGGAGGQAEAVAGELAGGRRVATGPRQVRLSGRCRFVPRQVRLRARDRRRRRLSAVVPGRAGIVMCRVNLDCPLLLWCVTLWHKKKRSLFLLNGEEQRELLMVCENRWLEYLLVNTVTTDTK